ncbi:hypothetical protein SAMN06265348_11329 [Pedobacter westerhofensis]|uniref:Uncharacterized protein n=1 Tax=Pedobacter westerhofensis TaxID=425512 RepID=A0A521FJ85_9SPHI|nr:hypothetical protein [Pedobacter westerhofensis]SMO96267.1 hypothetical protein SAMN06265348_11329 [Pedobacter westerhofensis]
MKGEEIHAAKIDSDILIRRATAGNQYYRNSLGQIPLELNNRKLIELMRNAAEMYPDNLIFFYELIKSLKKEDNPKETCAVANSFSAHKIRFHILRSVYFKQLNEYEREQQEMFRAFNNGLGLFDASKTYDLEIGQRPYYAQLLMSHASATNNTFIPSDFDKEKTAAFLDTVYCSIPEYRSATGGTKKILEASRAKEYARSLGNIEEYLHLLENSNLPGPLISFEVLDRIECLFILKRADEAIDYAKKVTATGDLKIQNVNDGAHINYANRCIKTIYNIADAIIEGC